MSKQTEEQHQALNEKLREVEGAWSMAKLYSNQAACSMASEERRFIASFLFGRAVSSVFLSMDSGELAHKASEQLADLAEATHNNICNVVSGTYCFTDADSQTCFCNVGSIECLDIYEGLLSDLAKEEQGENAKPYARLSDSLLPASDFLVAIATIEGDHQAQQTARRIRDLLTA
jgi:hypothetical protein